MRLNHRLSLSNFGCQDGKIMISAVPNKNQPMIVVVVTKQQVLLGQIMHGMNKAIKALQELDEKYHA